MSGKKILWLCSWYPSKIDRYNGDFIQRHARAASLFNDIYVIHVAMVPGDQEGLESVEEKHVSVSLTEKFIYFKSPAGYFGRFISNFRLIRLYRKAILDYINKYGKPELLHVHVPMKSGIAGMWAKRKFGLPLVVTEHWGIYNRVVADNYYQRSRVFKAMIQKIIRSADVFVSVSNYLVHQLKQLISLNAVRIIPNTADTNLFYFQPSVADHFRFIHVSNMVPLKNAEGILRAFKELIISQPQVELVMVGNQDDQVENFALTIGLLNRVKFRGVVPYEQVAAEMQGSHCLVLFSHIENSPCVLGEAHCCGLPVIATSVGGIPELTDDSNALLVSPANEKDLKEAMEKMIEEYSKFNRVGIAERARKRYSYESIGKQLDDMYSSAIMKQG